MLFSKINKWIRIKIAKRCEYHLWPVWQNWTILESSWQQILLQKKPKYLETFWTILKTSTFKCKLLWQFFVTLRKNWFGQLYLPTSGHTVTVTFHMAIIRPIFFLHLPHTLTPSAVNVVNQCFDVTTKKAVIYGFTVTCHPQATDKKVSWVSLTKRFFSFGNGS